MAKVICWCLSLLLPKRQKTVRLFSARILNIQSARARAEKTETDTSSAATDREVSVERMRERARGRQAVNDGILLFPSATKRNIFVT